MKEIYKGHYAQIIVYKKMCVQDDSKTIWKKLQNDHEQILKNIKLCHCKIPTKVPLSDIKEKLNFSLQSQIQLKLWTYKELKWQFKFFFLLSLYLWFHLSIIIIFTSIYALNIIEIIYSHTKYCKIFLLHIISGYNYRNQML